MFTLKILARTLSLLSLGISCFASSSLFAAKPINLSKEVFPLTPVMHALTTITDNSSDAFHVLNSHTDENQVTHAHIQQMYAGQPVFGADAGVHVKSTMNRAAFSTSAHYFIRTLNDPAVVKNGILYTDLEKDLGKMVPQNISNQAAQKAILHFYQTIFAKQNQQIYLSYNHEKVNVIVYVDKNNKAHWAYLVTFLAEAKNEMPKNPIAIIDAENHTIYKQWDNIKTLSENEVPAQATGYGGNPLLGKWLYGKDKPVLPISRNATDNRCLLRNKEVEVVGAILGEPDVDLSFSCPNTTNNNVNYEIPAQIGLSELNNGAYSPVNDALYYGMVIKQLYQDWYNTPVLVQEDKTTPLLLSMNLMYFNGPYSTNAFWNSATQKMYFGLGNAADYYPFVSLNIAAHEVSHGFTEQHSGLMYVDQSGALNESYSDMASAAASYYASGETETEWTLGGEILKKNLGKDKKTWEAIRYFDHPTKDGKSIDHVNQYNDLEKRCTTLTGGGSRFESCMVHFASGVFNKAFYNLATTPGWNTKSAFAVMMKTNRDYYWTANATFQSAACGVKQVAISTIKTKSVAEIEKDVAQAFNGVGISLSAC